MAKKYVSLGYLSVASELLNFVNNELLPGTGVTKKRFWDGLDKCAHKLAPINKKLLYTRDEIQKKIDKWHADNKNKEFNSKTYETFLKKIGYLVKEGNNFSISSSKSFISFSNSK